jgi:hypothetical protein
METLTLPFETMNIGEWEGSFQFQLVT